MSALVAILSVLAGVGFFIASVETAQLPLLVIGLAVTVGGLAVAAALSHLRALVNEVRSLRAELHQRA